MIFKKSTNTKKALHFYHLKGGLESNRMFCHCFKLFQMKFFAGACRVFVSPFVRGWSVTVRIHNKLRSTWNELGFVKSKQNFNVPKTSNNYTSNVNRNRFFACSRWDGSVESVLTDERYCYISISYCKLLNKIRRNSAESFWRIQNGAEILIERLFQFKVCEIYKLIWLHIGNFSLKNN